MSPTPRLSFIISATIYGKRSIELISMSILGLLATYSQTIMWWKSRSTTISVSFSKSISSLCFLFSFFFFSFFFLFVSPPVLLVRQGLILIPRFFEPFSDSFLFQFWTLIICTPRSKWNVEALFTTFLSCSFSFPRVYSCFLLELMLVLSIIILSFLSLFLSLLLFFPPIYLATLFLSISTCYDVWHLPDSWEVDRLVTELQDYRTNADWWCLYSTWLTDWLIDWYYTTQMKFNQSSNNAS